MDRSVLPEIIETKRLVLRPHRLEDVDDIFDFERRSAELGYSVARKHWNQGICTEAAGAVIDAAFSTHEDLNRVHARADADNVGSQRVMEKIGMVKEGVLRLNRVERGEAFDEAVFSILRREWKP